MRHASTWTCDDCGGEQQLRKIDTHRWVTSALDISGKRLEQEALFQLCPSCRVRRIEQNETPSRRWLDHDMYFQEKIK